ncbi:hypothetical protein SAMN05660653_02786 [Desulfonatronum thiosulfatophilum]|uniref:Type II secretion system protein N n=1 Tax=Desulfonatronum thiosulfatophilum TaxID=617002 RepID=A0A1G6EDS9_9BACT|nr:hypothetical protein [Desulfonatronum thiosulfatophilum]SDB55584.1 hypothetical protein SAMN05660653_02786 [Desulfonatronum thiosulfatophilum]
MTSEKTTQAAADTVRAEPGFFKRLGVTGTIFFIGLLLGLLFFLSREVLWGQVLKSTLGNLPQTTWSWQAVGDRGLTHITYGGFDVMMNQSRLYFPELTINLGTSRPVTLEASTGPVLFAGFGWNRNLNLSGAVDIQKMLPELRVQGTLETEGFLNWRNWNEPPYLGELQIHAPGLLVLAPGIMTINLQGHAFLDGNHLRLTSIRADGPIALIAEAEALLDWDNLKNSTYTISGTLLGLGNMPFSASGRLGSIW